MLMSERQWRNLSLLGRLGRGEVTVGEVAASLGRSRRQVQRMRKRFAGSGAAGLVHGNTGCSPSCRLPPRDEGSVFWGVLQDRLISELGLAGASTRGQANKVQLG
jgi:hypothetical protein